MAYRKLVQLVAAPAVAVSLLLPACAADTHEGDTEPVGVATEGLITRLELDRATVDFVEFDGLLAVVALSEPGAPNPAVRFTNRGMTPPEIYEALSGEPAPLALIEAAERFGMETAPYVAEPEIGVTSQALTASEFCAKYPCESAARVETDQNMNIETRIGGRAKGLNAFFHSRPDSASQVIVDFRHRKAFNNYTTAATWNVDPGGEGWIGGSTSPANIKRLWKLRVRGVASNDFYHFAAFPTE